MTKRLSINALREMRADDGGLREHVRVLKDELQVARARIAAMENAITGEARKIVGGQKLTRSEGMILGVLVKNGYASKETLRQVLYVHRHDGGPGRKVLDVFICHLRKKLPEGVTIRTVWGMGYEIPDESLALLGG